MTMEHIDRSFQVSLGLLHASIDPEEITRALGRTPTDTKKAGFSRKGVRQPGPFSLSGWTLHFDVRGARDLVPILEGLVVELRPHATFFREFTEDNGRVELFCAVLADGNWDESLPHMLLRELAALSIDLRLDVYPKHPHARAEKGMAEK